MKAFYDDSTIESIRSEYIRLGESHLKTICNLRTLEFQLKEDLAKEYLTHGLLRRFLTLKRCIDNIFRLFPVENTSPLEIDELTDVSVNLHAFFINISGLLDNIAWVIIHENTCSINRNSVGLFYEKSQKLFPPSFSEYLNTEGISNWHCEHEKLFRDSLAHRIPVFIPSNGINERDRAEYLKLSKEKDDLGQNPPKNPLSIISTPAEYDNANKDVDNWINQIDEIDRSMKQFERPAPYFTHSIVDDKDWRFLHPQLVNDFNTVVNIIDTFINCVSEKGETIPDEDI